MSRPNRHLDLPERGPVGDPAAGDRVRPYRAPSRRRAPLCRRSPDLLATLACLLALVTHPGCVALHLPSERYHDPDDLGGMLGRWKHARGPMPPSHVAEGSSCLADSSDPADEGAGPAFVPGRETWATQDEPGCDPFAPGYDPFAPGWNPFARGDAEKPVPWPKYHPVPTRPVFGGTDPFGAAP